MVRFLKTNKGALILEEQGLIHSLFSYVDLCFKIITKIPGNIHTWPNSESRTWSSWPLASEGWIEGNLPPCRRQDFFFPEQCIHLDTQPHTLSFSFSTCLRALWLWEAVSCCRNALLSLRGPVLLLDGQAWTFIKVVSEDWQGEELSMRVTEILGLLLTGLI